MLDIILKVCKKEIKPAPKKVIYSPIIEDSIVDLQKKLNFKYLLPNHLLRWISLKIIDGEETILRSIEKNFSVELLDNIEIKLIKVNIINNLKNANLTNENFKDIIVSSIMNRAQAICEKVCSFDDKNYSRKR